MTPTSSGGNANIGRPPEPTPQEMEMTASAQYNRASLGIVSDTIEQSFIQLSPRFNFGYLGGFGYRTTPDRPLLDHSLENVRTQQSTSDAVFHSTQPVYDELVAMLPPNIQTALQNNQGNQNFTALGNILNTAAEVLTQAGVASQPPATGSVEETRTALNLLLPFAALQGGLTVGNEVGPAALNYVAGQGANYSYFDSFNNILNGMQVALGNLNTVSNNLGSTLEEGISKEVQAVAERAAGQLTALVGQMKNVSTGSDLQILLPTLNALSIVALSLSLPETGSAPLFLALSTAMIGMEDSTFTQAAHAVSNAVLPGANQASTQYFAMLVDASLTLLTSLATVGVNNGLGVYPQGSNTAYFAFTAALQMALGSGVMNGIYNEIITAAGGNEAEAPALALGALMTIILAAAQEAEQPATGLVESSAKYLQDDIKAAEQLADEISANNQTADNQAAALAVALKQADAALEAKNYQGVIEAFSGLLGNSGTSLTVYSNNLSDMSNTTNDIAATLGQNNPDQAMTNIINVV